MCLDLKKNPLLNTGRTQPSLQELISFNFLSTLLNSNLCAVLNIKSKIRRGPRELLCSDLSTQKENGISQISVANSFIGIELNTLTFRPT